MSFFRTQSVNCNDQALLVKTLEQLGYKPQVNESKVKVRGHGSETRTAEIILRKEDINDGGDIGFSKNKDGNYDMVTDTYVIHNLKLAKLTEELNMKYSENKAKAIAKKNGWTVVKSQEATVNGKRVQRLQFVVA
jgi:hypothetical protein